MASNRTLEQLIEDWAPRLRQAFLQGVYAIRDGAQIAQIVRMLEKGDIDGAIRAAGIDVLKFRALESAVTDAYGAGGSWQTGQVPALRQADGFVLNIGFDIRNIAAESWIRAHSSQLVREISEGQRDTVREALTRGLEAGNNPRKVALDIVGRIDRATGRREGGTIGLTSSQAQWVANYEQELIDLDGAGLKRELRDARFDRRLLRAIKAEKPLTDAERLPMVNAYRNRLLKWRADAIARTEALSALNKGAVDGMQQTIEAGQIDAGIVEKEWLATGDKRTRDSHRALDRKRIPYGSPGWFSPSGALLRYPGDPDAPAAERINCRCTVRMRIDFLAGIE